MAPLKYWPPILDFSLWFMSSDFTNFYARKRFWLIVSVSHPPQFSSDFLPFFFKSFGLWWDVVWILKLRWNWNALFLAKGIDIATGFAFEAMMPSVLDVHIECRLFVVFAMIRKWTSTYQLIPYSFMWPLYMFLVKVFVIHSSDLRDLRLDPWIAEHRSIYGLLADPRPVLFQ